MNITNTIWRNCDAYPDRVAIVYEGRSISYQRLRATVERASARLAAAGITKGHVVGLAIDNRLAYVVTLLSAVRLGAVVTPLDPEHRDRRIATNGIDYVVLDSNDTWRSDKLPPSRFVTDRTLLGPTTDGEHVETPPIAQGLEEEPWMISLSSGTTGVPKSNIHTHLNGMLTATLTVPTNIDDQSRTLVFVGLGVYFGIARVIRQLYAGMTTVLTNALSPNVFFTAVNRDRPTRVIMTTGSAAAVVAYAMKNMPESLAACSSIRSVMISGGPVSPALRKGITERICPTLEVLYGATEAGTLALATPETHTLHPGSAGRIAAWVQAEAVDETDRPLPPGKVGLLRFRSPLVTNTYLDDPEATARAFRNGWFYPGDTGAIGPAGYLFLGGRIDAVLNVGGNKIDPASIEKLLEEDPAIVESAVVATVERNSGMGILVAVVVAQAEFDTAALKRRCLTILGKKHVPQAIVQIDALPRNNGGKVMRRKLAARLNVSSKKQHE